MTTQIDPDAMANLKLNHSMHTPTATPNAARDAGQFIILVHGRGDYLTGLKLDGEVMGGSAEDAIRYTQQEAASLVAELGNGYSVEAAHLHVSA